MFRYFLIAKSIYDHTIIFFFQGKYYKKDTAIHSLHTVVLQHYFVLCDTFVQLFAKEQVCQTSVINCLQSNIKYCIFLRTTWDLITLNNKEKVGIVILSLMKFTIIMCMYHV